MLLTSSQETQDVAVISAIEAELSRRERVARVAPVFQPLLQPSRYKGAWGGRGGAKSHFFADLLINDCLTKHIRAVCVREHQVSLEQSVKRLLEDKISEYGLDSKFRIMNNYIEAPFDGVIIFQGMKNHTAASIKSLEGYNRAWVEEAQSLSQTSLRLLRPTLRAADSEIWFSWNPDKATDPVDEFLRGPVLPPNAVVVKANWQDNPWFPEVLRQEMEWDRNRDPDKYAHVWMGEYQRKSEARVFKNWSVREFETPDDVALYLGGDWGFSADPSVLIRCWANGRTLYIDYEAYQVGCEIDNTGALFDTVPGARSWPIIADSARPETISYLNRHGFPKMMAAKKGPDSVKEGVIFLQGYDIVVHPRCVHAIDELTLYSYKTDPLTGTIMPILEDKKNHVIDSLRYAVERLRKPYQKLTW